VKEAVVGDARYVYLTERACGLLALLGYSLEEAGCGLLLRKRSLTASGSRPAQLP